MAGVATMKHRTHRFVFLAVFLLMCLVVIAACGNPGAPVSGKTAPHTSINQLRDTVDKYAAQGILTSDQAKGLIASLEKAHAELNRGNARLAREHLDIFKREVQALTEKGMLLDPHGQALVTRATGIQADLDLPALAKWRAKPLPPSVTGCAEIAPCEYTILYVDIRSKLLGSPERERLDGSANMPLPSIAAALERAQNLGLCGVEIRIAPGVYPGDLTLSRGIRLLGESEDAVTIMGSILDYGGFDLDVEDLTIRDSGRHGGIVIDRPCAIVQVIRVRIEAAEKFGLYQRGGTLTVVDAEIRETSATDDTVYGGTGVFLDVGVQAAFHSTRIQDNESAGLVLQGSETRFYGAWVTVTGSRINPYFLDQVLADAYIGYAAVEVRGGALLLMEFCTIDENEGVGLALHGGARAHFRYGSISSTHFPKGVNNKGGINVIALDSTEQIHNFTISHADLAGLVIQNAYITLDDGEVGYNQVGLAIRPYDDPNYNPLRCIRNEHIAWMENGLSLDGSYMPVPEPIEGLDLDGTPGADATPEEIAPCPEVPFECNWCG
jgi:hypothetical protein